MMMMVHGGGGGDRIQAFNYGRLHEHPQRLSKPSIHIIQVMHGKFESSSK